MGGRGPPGQPAYLMGPSGAFTPDPEADWYLFAGDEAALPAIGAALEALPDDAIGRVFIEVAGPDDQIRAHRRPRGVGSSGSTAVAGPTWYPRRGRVTTRR